SPLAGCRDGGEDSEGAASPRPRRGLPMPPRRRPLVPRVPLIAYATVAALVLLVTVVLPASGAIAVPSLPVGSGDVREGEVAAVLLDERQESQRGTVRRQVLAVDVGGQRVEVENVVVEG